MKTILISPIITEKSMAHVKNHKFSFLVASDASKEAIKKAIKATFNVDPIGIQTTVQKGKTQRVGIRRMEKQRPAYKKAIITLKADQKIDIFDLGV
ncbi:50S ribosomal protein L23 [soil metagenome]